MPASLEDSPLGPGVAAPTAKRAHISDEDWLGGEWQTDSVELTPLVDAVLICRRKCTVPCHRIEAPDVVECQIDGAEDSAPRVLHRGRPDDAATQVHALKVTDLGTATFVICFEAERAVHCHVGSSLNTLGPRVSVGVQTLVSVLSSSPTSAVVCHKPGAGRVECLEAQVDGDVLVFGSAPVHSHQGELDTGAHGARSTGAHGARPTRATGPATHHAHFPLEASSS